MTNEPTETDAPMSSPAEPPGQEPPEEAARVEGGAGADTTPPTASGDETPPATSETGEAGAGRSDEAEQARGSASEESPTSGDEEQVTDRLFDAVAEWLRERPGAARLAGRDYHEHRVVFNLGPGPPGSGEPAEIVGYELTATACADVQQVFVKPEGYDEAHTTLGKRRLLFLSGRPQLGKGTAANYLALSYAGATGNKERPRKLVRLEPTTPLTALHRFHFEQDTAYVIDTLVPRRALELEPFQLELVEQRLQASQAYLVISVDDGSLPRLVAGAGNTLDWNHGPDLALVLQRHAIKELKELGDLPQQRETVRTWLRSPKVAAVLPELRRPQEAVELAKELARAAADDTLPADARLDRALDRHGARTASEAVAGFDNAGPERRAWLLALASLEGCAFSTVAEARQRLWQQLRPDPDDEQEPVERPELRRLPRTALLRELGAETFSAYVPHAHGHAKAIQVRLRGTGTAEAILRHVWEEHDALRQPILDWLDELVVERPEAGWEVAHTLGMLGTFDFSYLLVKVLQPWIVADPQRRVAVAMAIGWSARGDNQRQQVTALLDYWVDNGGTRERWTAAVACGSVFGLSYPDDALDLLRRIVERDPLMLGHVVPRSVVSLFEGGAVEPELHLTVLRAMEGWTRERRRTAADAGRRAFLQLVQPGQERPARVWTAADYRSCVASLATLWRRLLDTPSQRRDALAALRRAFEQADRDPELADKLTVLVEEIARTARRDERVRLRYQLATWGHRRGASSATARRCLELIPSP